MEIKKLNNKFNFQRGLNDGLSEIYKINLIKFWQWKWFPPAYTTNQRKEKMKSKFKTNDIIKDKASNVFFKIRNVYNDCYDAMDCDKDGNLTGGSIDIWFDNSLKDEGYPVENDFEKVSL